MKVRRTKASVLGIDAAWTPGNASGVALITKRAGRWYCVRLSASYQSFVNASSSVSAASQRLSVERLLHKCRELLRGDRPQVVAVDMPIATKRIVGRRAADRAVSRRFGHAGCSTHSPTRTRPGRVSTDFVQQFTQAGFRCDFGGRPRHDSLIEVYPHVALLALLNVNSRLQYKAHKTIKYWPNAPIDERRRLLLVHWDRILAFLRRHIDGIDLELPNAASTFAELKSHEDQIDALISAWVGSLYLEKKALALGDEHSAIWIPTEAMRFGRC